MKRRNELYRCPAVGRSKHRGDTAKTYFNYILRQSRRHLGCAAHFHYFKVRNFPAPIQQFVELAILDDLHTNSALPGEFRGIIQSDE